MIVPALLILFPLMRRRDSSPVTRHSSLRSDVPAIPNPPDRADWEKEHGKKPYLIPTVADIASALGIQIQPFQKLILNHMGSGELDRFTAQAREAISRDLSTIERDEAIGEQVTLEHICQRVKIAARIPNGDHVFFDSQDNHFWVYPSPAKPDESRRSLGEGGEP